MLLLFAKSHARLTCSVAGALTTVRCRYQLFASCVGVSPPAKTVKTRRRKLHIACGGFFAKAAGVLIPLLLLFAKGHAAPSLLACRRARNAPACYQPFSGCVCGCFFRAALALQRSAPLPPPFAPRPSRKCGRRAGNVPGPAPVNCRFALRRPVWLRLRCLRQRSVFFRRFLCWRAGCIRPFSPYRKWRNRRNCRKRRR